MVEKFYPKNKCPDCETITWNYNINTKRVKCTKCGLLIEKKLHGIIGAEISKNERGHYVLAFPELKEEDTFSSWDLLKEEMDKLAGNEVKNERDKI